MAIFRWIRDVAEAIGSFIAVAVLLAMGAFSGRRTKGRRKP